VNVNDLLAQLPLEVQQRSYILRLDVLELTPSLVKARLIISPDIFVQIYRNDRYDSTNLALIQNEKRIYGRDRLGNSWHRHTVQNPDDHDRTKEGMLAVSLSEFQNEVESVLAELGLP